MIQQARTEYVNTLWRAKGSHIFFFAREERYGPAPPLPATPSPPQQPIQKPRTSRAMMSASLDRICLISSLIAFRNGVCFAQKLSNRS